MTALLLLFISIVFLSDYHAGILPKEQAYYFTLIMKYYNSFVLMSFSIYFYKKITSIHFRGLSNYLYLAPLIGIILIISFPSIFNFETIETSTGRFDRFSLPFVILLISCSMYSVYWTVYFLIMGNKRAALEESSDIYKRRLKFLTKGCILTVLAMIVSVSISALGSFFGITLTFIAPYGIFVLAYTIRYSMVHFEWLTTFGHKYELLYKISSNGILLLDETGRIIDVNPAFCKMVVAGKETIVGKNVSNFIVENERSSFINKFQSKHFNSTERHQLSVLTSLSRIITVELTLQSVEIDDNKFIYFIVRDITSQTLYEKRLKYLAYHDPLTGLGNRTAFHEAALNLLKSSKNGNSVVALAVIDLDRFKWVNDTYGHLEGDRLLIRIAKQIVSSVPENAHASRMGGDEFAVLIPETNEQSIIPYIEKLSKNIAHQLASDFSVTGSIGVSFAHKDGSDIDTLMKLSDKALYYAKANGKNQYCIYSPSIDEDEKSSSY
ncbi:sensor domain-containing diguanylate cyclase [Metabacillus malikii]|uniref:Diguanylate cyclase (GGDEF)-like protein/PAS domain S-box-containing protein n=1 Tax=Metabacillus malikii TaxID=1504265 RepID=A0ABT9ZFU6_9BACI|nr:sensor domain-containing diguanylate cyclase [Metabacillus malikii]MDQ0230433.1 diguanylate cyclase (GGDEF)-like protein/PAS domain S-box-containing protein [Metabacillus malikii]